MRQMLAELSRLVSTGTPLQTPCEPPPPDRLRQRREVTIITSLLSETVADDSQGVPLAMMQELAPDLLQRG